MPTRQLFADVNMDEEAELRSLESGTPFLPRVRLLLNSPPDRLLRQRVTPQPDVTRSPTEDPHTSAPGTHTPDECAASVTSSPDAENVLQSDRSGLTVCPTHNNQEVVGGDTRINLEAMTPNYPLTSEASRELVQVLTQIAW